jgi:hypothetical protein
MICRICGDEYEACDYTDEDDAMEDVCPEQYYSGAFAEPDDDEADEDAAVEDERDGGEAWQDDSAEEQDELDDSDMDFDQERYGKDDSED